MNKNKGLPILKTILFPAVGYLAYSAYCYYSQQYAVSQKTQNQSVKYLQQLDQSIKNAQTILEIKNFYTNINKHVNRFIIDPSLNKAIITNTNSEKTQATSFWSSLLKIQRQWKINGFNSYKQTIEGVFSFGYWTNIVEGRSFMLKDTDSIETLLAKIMQNRVKKCEEIGSNYAKDMQRNYQDVYYDCLMQTNEQMAKMQRYLGFISRFKDEQI